MWDQSEQIYERLLDHKQSSKMEKVAGAVFPISKNAPRGQKLVVCKNLSHF